MDVSFLYFLLLSSLFLITNSCRCAPKKPGIIFCNTDWTSHVKIIGKYTVESYEGNEDNILTFGKNILYLVEHSEIFKTPKNDSSLPNAIFTPESGATCGIMGLEVKKEYLLSGTLDKGVLKINSCSQMYGEGSSDYGATPQEWSAVPSLQKNMLKNCLYNNCTDTIE